MSVTSRKPSFSYLVRGRVGESFSYLVRGRGRGRGVSYLVRGRVGVRVGVGVRAMVRVRARLRVALRVRVRVIRLVPGCMCRREVRVVEWRGARGDLGTARVPG